MTELYFVRHAEPDYGVHDDLTRPLTEKGRRDCKLAADYLRPYPVSLVVSSPFRRARDTVAEVAESRGLEIVCVDAFRERKITDGWITNFPEYAERQWKDFAYRMENGECLAEVQERNVAALNALLTDYPNRTIAVGTHGTALSSIINYYDPAFLYKEFLNIVGLMPFIAHLSFEEKTCVLLEIIDVFSGKTDVRLRKNA